MAFTSIAALAAGEAATATLVLGAVSEVGLAMTVVGAVTGDKTLMKVGGVMGLVGGFGGMMAGAASGAAAAAGPGEAGWGMDLGTDAVSGLSSGASAGSGLASVGDVGWGADLGTDAVSGVSGGSNSFTSTVDDALQSLDSTTSTVSDVTGPTGASTAPPTPAYASTPSAPSTSAPSPLVSQPADARNGSDVMSDNFDASTANNGTTPGNFQLAPADSKSFFSSFLTWVKNNKEMANGIMKLGGEALKGMSERDMFDQKMALENKKYGYGNQVANYSPRPLIGAR